MTINKICILNQSVNQFIRSFQLSVLLVGSMTQPRYLARIVIATTIRIRSDSHSVLPVNSATRRREKALLMLMTAKVKRLIFCRGNFTDRS